MKKIAIALNLTIIIFILFLFNNQTIFAFDNTQALKKANGYLAFMAFSHDGLITQLKFDGFTQSEAEYAADNCGADWNKQAIKKADSYLAFMAFSHDGLIVQLKFDGFTQSEAEYAADNCGADWKKQAVKKAESYLSFIAMSDSALLSQLKYDGFTQEEADYALLSIRGEEKKESYSFSNPNSEESRAIEKAKSYLQYDYSRKKIIDKLLTAGFSKEIAEHAADNCNADWNQQAISRVTSYLQFDYSASKIYKKLLDDGFTEEQAQYGIINCQADWVFIAYNKALSYVNYNYSNEKIFTKLKSDGFTEEQAAGAVYCLTDPNCNGMNIDLISAWEFIATNTPTATYTPTSTNTPTATYTTTSTNTPTVTSTPTATYTITPTTTPTTTSNPTATYTITPTNLIPWRESSETLVETNGDPISITETDGIRNMLICYRYKTDIAEIPAFIDYTLEENKLVSITIILDNDYDDPNLYFADYDIVKATLIKKYGMPVVDQETWDNGLLGRMYKNDKGKALMKNAISKNTVWNNPTAMIMMEMHKDNTDSGVVSMISFFDWNYLETDISISVTPTAEQKNLFTNNSEVLTPAVGEWVNCGDKFRFKFHYQPMMTKSQSYITANGMFILFRVNIQNLTDKDYLGISGFELSKTEDSKNIRYPLSIVDSWLTSDAWEIDQLQSKLDSYRMMDTYLVFDVNGSADDDWVLTFAPRDSISGRGAICSVKMKLPKISYEP